MNSSLRIILINLIFIVILFCLIGITYFNYSYSVKYSGGEDFIPRWLGAKYFIKLGTSPYQDSVSQAAQKMLYNRPAIESVGEDKGQFLYPLTSMLILAPFGLMEFDWARAIWMTTIEVSLVFLILLSIKLVDWKIPIWKILLVLFLGLFGYHSIHSIIKGQFIAIESVFIVLGLILIMQKQDILAGIIFALSTVNPAIIMFLIPFIMIWSISVRRFDLFLSFIISTFVLLLASLAFSPNWIFQWINQLIDYVSSNSNYTSALFKLSEELPGIQSPLNIFFLVLFGGYMLFECILALGKDKYHFLWTAMLIIVISNLIGYRTSTKNFISLLPVLIFILQAWEQKWDNKGKIFVVFIIVFMGLSIWGLALLAGNPFSESTLLHLFLPVSCLVGLIWIRWWFVKPAKFQQNKEFINVRT